MRVSLANLLIIVGTLLAVFGVALLIMRLHRWRRDVALRRHSDPILVVPLDSPASPRTRPQRAQEVTPAHRAPPSVSRATPVDLGAVAPVETADLQYVSQDDEFTRRITPTAGADGGQQSEGASAVDAPRIHFEQPEEGTLEFLPGRLEVVSGEGVGQEIHFARRVGEEDTTVTFGRSDGPPLRHVQLLDPTVSRLHARMTFARGHWQLVNLSTTNPVVLNGTRLAPQAGELTLADGDRIEMGSVMFVFRSQ